MWVCDACKGVYFPAVAEARGKCPGCSGSGHTRECYKDDAGVVTPVALLDATRHDG